MSDSGSSSGEDSDYDDQEVCDEDYNDWEDEQDMPTACLFHPDVIMLSPEQALAMDKETEGFDLCDLMKTLHLDLYGGIKVINYIRTSVQEGIEGKEIVARIKEQGPTSFLREEDDTYLCPVIPDDPMLYALGNLLESHGMDLTAEEESDHHQARGGSGVGGSSILLSEIPTGKMNGSTANEDGDDVEKLPYDSLALEQENRALRAETAELKARVARMSELMTEMDAGVKIPRPKFLGQDNDTYYFNSYAHHGIHETMLKDSVRTLAYQKAIEMDASQGMKGKVVLDVGCGTGVLSMFAAKAGAAKVIGVDCSDIIDQAARIVKLNGLDNIVTLVKGKVEEVKLPVEKVDVIVSEWMGYCLLYESMLPSVLLARDKYLAPGGRILPNRCTMIIEGMTDSEGRLDWSSDVYGLDMTPLRQGMLIEPAVEVVNAEAIITNAYNFKDFDLMTIKDTDLDFEASFEIQVTKSAPFQGLVISFDTFFDGPSPSSEVVELSTTPQVTATHWAQTLLWLKDAPTERKESIMHVGDKIKGKVRMLRNAINHREYDISIQWSTHPSGGGKVMEGEQTYKLGG